MKTILAAIFKETVVSFVALLVLVALIWFGGEYFGYSTELRIGVIIAVLAVWLGLYIVQRVLAVRRSLLIEKRLRAQAEEQIAASRPTEKGQLAELEKQLREALTALRNSKLGKRALYALPWYVVIGPPGSGKSTALEQSGLNFPFTSGGGHGVRGVGGTRNCDWWFTDQGILLDTAGRYTTQTEDRDEWLGFLDMIKKVRKQKPINGAIVAISISDLLTGSDTVIEEHGRQVRDRLDELCRGLEQVFPVYLLFTKCDLLRGFVDFFEDMGREQRAQVWGFTLPYNPLTTETYQEKFTREVQELFHRLCDARVGRITSDRPDEKKAGIFEFPVQFRLAQQRLGEFVGQVFRANPYQESSILRGIYFSSGTQEGLPIDQLVSAMKGAYGIEASAAAAAPVVEKKSYFLTHLFTKLIFPDQNLARSSTKVARRRRLVRFAACAGAIIGLVGIGSLLFISFGANKGLVDDVGSAATAVQDSARTSPNDAPSRLGTLETFRTELLELDELEREGRPLHMRWGLYQGRKIAAPAREFYFGHLTSLLLQPAVGGIETELQALHKEPEKETADYERMYELHRVYLMIAGLLNPVKSDLEATFQDRNRWFRGLGVEADDTLPDEVRRLGYEQLGFFLSQLDRPEEWKISTSENLIRATNDQLSQNHWVFQSYRQIRDTSIGELPKVGMDQILERPGRRLLRCDEEFSGLFTQKGWDANCKPALIEKCRLLAERYEDLGITNSPEEIGQRLGECYQEQSRRHWRRFLDGFQLVEIDDIADAAAKLKVLADPEDSPLAELFTTVWAAQDIVLDLPGSPKLPEVAALDDGAAEPERTWLDDALAILARVQGPLDGLVASTATGRRIMPAALEDKLGSLDPLREAFQTAARDLPEALQRAPRDQRALASRLFTSAFERSRDAFLREGRAEVDGWWKQNVKEVVSGTLALRYPFAEAKEEASMDAVGKVFRPGSGTIWQARQAVTRLSDYVFDQAPLVPVSGQIEAVFKRAEELRDALFLGGSGENVEVRFKVRLIQRSRVKDMRFTVGNETFSLYDRPDRKKDMTWGQGASGVKLSISASRDQWLDREFTSGEWGLIRLLRDGRIKPQPGAGGRKFRRSWELTARDASAQKYEADLEFESALETNVFRHDVFAGWDALPDKVGQ